MTSDQSRYEILKSVEDGTLTAEEGSDLIGILERGCDAAPEAEVLDPIPPMNDAGVTDSPRVSGWWKALWSLILLGGALLTGFSALWSYRGYERAGLGWGFWLSWIPFILGVLLMVFGGILLDSPWMHLKVSTRETGKAQKFHIAIPVPLKLVSWGISRFGYHVPSDLRGGIEDVLREVEDVMKRGEPFQIEVDDKEDGDQVYVTFAR
jgi:hypothetical protein